MSGDIKNQHYIPQSYLHRFSTNGRISVYKKDTDQILPNQNPRNFAAERYFYDVSGEEWSELIPKTQEDHPKIKMVYGEQPIEHLLSSIENDMKVLLDDISNNPSLLSDDSTRMKLSFFFHIMAYRTKNYREEIEKINEGSYHLVMKLSDTEEKRQWTEMFYENGAAKRQQLSVLLAYEPLIKTCFRLEGEYNWYWATAEKDGEFIISDDFPMFLRADSVEVIFPVSLKNAIILRKKATVAPIMGTDMPNGIFITVSLGNIVKYNLLQLSSMQSFAFGGTFVLEQMRTLWNAIQTRGNK